MYSKIGGILKAIAIIIAIIGVLASIIIGINAWDQSWSIIIGGLLASCLCFLALYGFGELIEIAQGIHQKLSTIEMQNRNILRSTSVSSNKNNSKTAQEYQENRKATDVTINKTIGNNDHQEESDHFWMCTCGYFNEPFRTRCINCGHERA